MIFEAAKCPSCGSPIQVPSESETAKCMFCGSALIVKDAIQKLKLELSGSVIVDSNIESMLKSAEGFVNLCRWNEAEKLYRKIVEIKSTDYRAWWGLVLVYTQNFMNFGDKHHASFYDSAMKLADSSIKDNLKKIYENYYIKTLKYNKIRNNYNQEAIYYDAKIDDFQLYTSPKSRTIALILCFPLGVYGLHRFYVGKFETGIIWMFSAGAMFVGFIYDLYQIISGSFTDSKGRPLRRW